MLRKTGRWRAPYAGPGFDASNLYRFVKFYEYYPEIFDAVSRKSPILSWTHYRALIQVHDKDARDWYEQEALREVWNFRTLQRNISSQYYYRLLKSQDQRPVKEEMEQLTSRYQQDKLEFIKNPVIAEFLGISEDTSFRESDLEQFIIDNLQKFMMELGKGYAFVGRQQHIRTEKDDYYIDLVFYNYILKCFVLIDLKLGKVKHQDIGQMQMYVNYYKANMRNEGDNEPIGIVLCAEKNEAVVKYTMGSDNSTHIYASKYMPYMPTEEELKKELRLQELPLAKEE